MKNETRNILLNYLQLAKHNEEKDFYLKEILNRYELELKDELEEIERQKEKIQENLELLNYIKDELKGGVNND